MGLKDHLEDGTGHILSLGLDLDYLHVEGTDRQASLSTTAGSGHLEAFGVGEGEVGAGAHNNCSRDSGSGSLSSSTSTSSSSNSSSCSSNCSEESAISDSDDERVQNSSVSESQHYQPHPCHHNQPPPSSQPDGQGLVLNRPLGEPPQAKTTPIDPITDYRTKVEFSLKLGYSEDLVLLVLRKLGPDALINDILGELVKLGTKTEMEQQGGCGSSVSQSFSSSTSSLSSSSLSISSAQSFSTSSLDSCRLLCPSQLADETENLRPVVVDGSNVAMSHGNKEVFSCQGIQLAVDWFLDRGHRDITVFVPAWRKEQSRPDALITDQETLRRLEKEKILVFTPSRRVQGRRVVCYDDRFIVKLAYESDGIIVSNDNYRDLANEKPEWKKFIDERLLMYSFVNDKFMPPDDPLGRHGPSLENFLRKRPVNSEHRKQSCPYGRKCTYGHKCKFYHPERGTQPQRAVADELRASAKSSSSASKTFGDALMVKSHGMPTSTRLHRTAETHSHQGPPKRQSDPGPSYSFSDLTLEDRLGLPTRVEARRGSNSSSSSSCSGSILGHPASWGPSSSSPDWRDLPGQRTTNVSVASGLGQAEIYPMCESPELGYSTLMRAYSSLSLVVPQSPERFFPADLRAGSMPSDCSSEGSSDSFSPDSLLDDSLKCRHHHNHHPYHHHHCPSRYPHSAGHMNPSLSQHPHHSYPLPQMLGRIHGFGFGEDFPSQPSHHPKPPLAYRPSHLQHPSLASQSSCPREYHVTPHPLPQPSTTHTQSQTSPLGRNQLASPWQDTGLQDSRLCEGSPLHPRRSYPGSNQPQQHLASWDPHYQQSPQPCYELPEGCEKAWHPPWRSGTHLSPRALPTSHLPPPALSPRHPSHNNHPPSAPQHQEPHALGRYQELREKVFVNLCNIFPPELVRMVMARNSHMIDAQQLAAAILMEKSQHGY